MSNRKDKAIELFSNGYNCAQSIIGAYADRLGKNTYVLMDMASGFGGGMGKLQKTCGAVTGAFIVMSSLNNHNLPGAREHLDQDIQEFARRFTSHFGELNCRDLIGYDLNAEEEKQEAEKTGVSESKCQRYIEFSLQTLEDLLSEDNN